MKRIVEVLSNGEMRVSEKEMCEDEEHEWIDPTKNLLECKKCGTNGLSEAAKLAIKRELKKESK